MHRNAVVKFEVEHSFASPAERAGVPAPVVAYPMGVPAFFKWLSTKYPKIVVDVIEEYQQWLDGARVAVDTSQPNPNGVEFDNLFLDMNGIIHPASHPEDRPAPKTEDDMYLCIADYLERVFACVRPRKLLFMAIDGVAPRAKMNQQRSRRFKSDQERREARRVEDEVRAEWEAEGRELPARAEGFDSNVITPGTPFMDRLALFLRAFICYKQSTDEAWRHLRVVLSDASVPGEGEHKIMEYIRQQRAQPGYDPNTHHALHGLDADLIMLALATHEPYFTILREYVGKGSKEGPKQGADSLEAQIAEAKRGEFGELQTSGGGPPPTPFQFLHVHILREYLFKEFSESRFCSPELFDFERLIDDFIFLCFFVGNDFLPHVPSLEIREGAIDCLIDAYKGLFSQPGGGYLCDGAAVDLTRVKMLTAELAGLEEELLRKRRENEQRDGGRKAQREQEVMQRTAERRHLTLLAESAQTPHQLARAQPYAGGHKRPRDGDGSDAALLSMFNTIKQFADGDGDEPVELSAALSGYERRMAHQYCDELALEHPTVGNEPNRRIMLKRKGGGGGGGGPPGVGSAMSAERFAEKLKAILREKAEILDPVDAVELGRDGWRERYYSQKLGNDWRAELPAMCEAYVRGLCWVMAYYYDGCPSWEWYYPYHYAPFATDLIEAIRMEDVSTHFEHGTPFKPLEQLMAVLPPGSAHALPPAYGALMKDEGSPLASIYPLTFECDMNGKRFAWQAVVLLPFIDQAALLQAVRAVEHTLTIDEARRNSLGESLVFVSEHHPLSKPLTQLQDERAAAAAAADGAPPKPPRRIALTMKVSRGMGGAISAVDGAPAIGDPYPLLPFRGERSDEALQPFVTRATYGAFHLPPRVAHKPQLLPGVQMPRQFLSTFDRPSTGRFTSTRGRRSFGGYANGGNGHSLPAQPLLPGAYAPSLPTQPPRPMAAAPPAPRSAAAAWLSHQQAAAAANGGGGPPRGPPPACAYGGGAQPMYAHAHPPPHVHPYPHAAAAGHYQQPRGPPPQAMCGYGVRPQLPPPPQLLPPSCSYLPPARPPALGGQCGYGTAATAPAIGLGAGGCGYGHAGCGARPGCGYGGCGGAACGYGAGGCGYGNGGCSYGQAAPAGVGLGTPSYPSRPPPAAARPPPGLGGLPAARPATGPAAASSSANLAAAALLRSQLLGKK